MAFKLVHAEFRPNGVAQPWLLILLHGLGSDEQDLISLAPELGCELVVISLRAPEAYLYGGYSWFGVEWGVDGLRYDEEDAKKAVAIVSAAVAEVQAAVGIPASRTLLGGFSQGAMVSLGVALSTPENLAGLVLLSGACVHDLVPETVPEAFKSLPILIQHGGSDPVLPLEIGHDLRDTVVGLGGQPDYREYARMGHQISGQSLAELKLWIEQTVQPIDG